MPDQPVDIPFPIRGVDRSLAAMDQPDGTCPDCLNVRPSTVTSDRRNGGKRHGYVKASTAQFGVSNHRVNNITVVPRTVIEDAPSKGNTQPVDLNGTAWLSYQGVTTQRPIWKGDYVVMNKKSLGTWITGEQQNDRLLLNSTQLRLEFSGTNSAALGGIVFAVNYRTTNSMAITVGGRETVGGTSDGISQNKESTYFGPFVRGSNSCRDFIVAYLTRVAENVAQLVVEKHENGVVTRLGASDETFTYSGTEIQVLNQIISIKATPDGITASATKPGSNSLTVAIQNNTDLAVNDRAGVWHGLGDNGDASNAVRWLYRMQYKRLVPPKFRQVAQLYGTDDFAGTGANNYILPTGWATSRVVPGVTNRVDGPYNSATRPNNGVGGSPAIKNDKDRIYGRANSADLLGGASIAALVTQSDNTAPTQRYAVETFCDAIAQGGTDSDGGPDGGPDEAHVCFRVSPAGAAQDYQNFWKIVWERRRNLVTASTAIGYIMRIRVYQVTSGGAALIHADNFETTLGTFTGDTPVFSLTEPLKWVDDGTTFKLQANGIVLWFYIAGTSGNTNKRVAVDVGSVTTDLNTSLTAGLAKPPGFRLVGEDTIPIVAPVSDGTDVLVFTNSSIEQYDAANPNVVIPVTAAGLTGAAIQTCVQNNKVIAVDGVQTLFVDPIAHTSVPLVANDGEVPVNCTLTALFRGSVVLASPAVNRAAVYLGKLGDPKNWVFNDADNLSTTAIPITFADGVAQPPDKVVAIFPWKDDFLVAGCDLSIWVMEGDPRAGGAFVCASQEVGVIGPNAWCFTADGTPIFLGRGGLYALSKGGIEGWRVVPIRENAVSDLLERVDSSLTDVRLVYDALKKTVTIFLAPEDGSTQGTHVAYFVPSSGVFPDRMPANFGPTAHARYHGEAAEDRRFLIGGFDGYVRRPDDDAFGDDGATIDSYVRYAPTTLAAGRLMLMATELQGFAGDDSDAVTWSILTGASAAQVNAQSLGAAVRTGTFFTTPGFQQPIGLRETGGAVQLVISQTSSTLTWNVESVSISIVPMGRRR